MNTTEALSLEIKARELATSLLFETETRLDHSKCVVDQTRLGVNLLVEPWKSVIIPAAWLHDIGYNKTVGITKFHPLDGARYLQAKGWSMEICRLVAWHTNAEVEAQLRDLDDLLTNEFEMPPSEPWVLLAWADLTSSPKGEKCSPQERLDEILERYRPESVVHRAIIQAYDYLIDIATDYQNRVFGI